MPLCSLGLKFLNSIFRPSSMIYLFIYFVIIWCVWNKRLHIPKIIVKYLKNFEFSCYPPKRKVRRVKSNYIGSFLVCFNSLACVIYPSYKIIIIIFFILPLIFFWFFRDRKKNKTHTHMTWHAGFIKSMFREHIWFLFILFFEY